MGACLYASDLNDEEWAELATLLHRGHPAGRRQSYPMRRIVDAILYLLRMEATGGSCRTSIHHGVLSCTTMHSGARMAPGST